MGEILNLIFPSAHCTSNSQNMNHVHKRKQEKLLIMKSYLQNVFEVLKNLKRNSYVDISVCSDKMNTFE